LIKTLPIYGARHFEGFNFTLTLMLLLAAWLVSGTGLASDDLALALAHRFDSSASFIPTVSTIAFPVEHYTHTLAYHYFSTTLTWGYDILKIAYTTLSLWMMARFFSLYLNPWRASVAAFVFIFLPNHDAAIFWFIGQYLMLSISAYCFAYYQFRMGRPTAGVLLSLLASFISYGSTPVACGLAILALLEGRRKNALMLFIPNAIYIAYYFVISFGFELGPQRIPSQIQFQTLLKQFVLQILTYADSTFGPAFFLKCILSIGENAWPEILVGCVSAALVWRHYDATKTQTSRPLLISLAVITILALGTFALTGRYPQIAFNLGDRVTIYGSLLISYCLVCFLPARLICTLVFVLVLFSALGLSAHWKNWTGHQEAIIAQIASNQAIKNLPAKTTLLVSGNQYSKLGPMSHIEFLSENYVVGTAFNIALGDDHQLFTNALNRRHNVVDDYLQDKKHDEKIALPADVWIYDSQQDKLFQVSRSKLNLYIETLPQDTRHWLQLLPPGLILNIAVKLMPRLQYAL
jgi:hypothetical protein